MRIKIANPTRAELNSLLSGVVGVVEANSFESMCLWKEAQERGDAWRESGGGPLVEVGELAGMPICCALSVVEVRGHRILFVDVTSQVTDSRQVEDWLRKTLPLSAFESGDARQRMRLTNAMNFHAAFPPRDSGGLPEGRDREDGLDAKQARAAPEEGHRPACSGDRI